MSAGGGWRWIWKLMRRASPWSPVVLPTVALATTAFATLLLLAAPAGAGTYRVAACDAAPGGANNSWVAEPDPGMLAYTDCPSRGRGSRGLVVRNRIERATVPRGRTARMTFTAPRGAALDAIEYDWDGISVARQWTLGLTAPDGRVIAGCSARAGGARSDCVLGRPKGTQLSRARLGGVRAVHLIARCGARRGCDTSATDRSMDRARGRLALRRAAVVVRDGSAPNLSVPTTGLLDGKWSRGVSRAEAHARDNVGIRSTVIAIDGTPRKRDSQSCDFTRPAPCPAAPRLADPVDTRLLADGAHRLSLTATDAAGNSRTLTRTIRVDNHAPAAPRNMRLLGPGGIRSENSFDLRWSPPPGQAAPIVSTRYRLCRNGSERCVSGARAGGATGIDGLAVPGRGDWRFRAWLVDAAGNASPANASRPVLLRFDDRPPARLSAAIETANGAARSATVGFRARPLVTGTLSTSAAGVPRAPVVVLSRVRGSERTTRVGVVRTDARGRFRYRVDHGPSRRLAFEFRGDDRARPANDRVDLAVRAKSSLSVSRRRVRNGDTVRFEGRILGPPIPREGKLLQLEAHYRGRWRTFAVTRADRHGRWHYRYRFEATTGTVTYPFKVRIPRERSYPYAVGRSRVVAVVVRG